MSRRLWLTVALLCAACGSEPARIASLEARIFVDRAETWVGMPVGVTVEIDAPRGFSVDRPVAPAPQGAFLTESIEALEPLELEGGRRHRLRWVLRARDIGDHSLPELEIPLVRPDGRIERLPVGRIPLRVLSARAELPEREAFFDIRPAPPPPRDLPVGWIAAGTLALLALAAFVVAQRRGPSVEDRRDDRGALAEAAAQRIERALQETDARRIADRLAAALLGFVAEHWQLDPSATTPDELAAEIDAEIVTLLAALEHERFRRTPRRPEVVALAGRARAFFGRAGHA